MADNKIVFDIRPNKDGISRAESNEQQRNWSEEFLRSKAKDLGTSYDPTRTHLNFEIAKGGVVQPIDKSMSIMERMAVNLEERKIKDPNARENVCRRQNTLAQIILGGSRLRMNEIAFGNQSLNLEKGADNSSLTREHGIEEWAKDAYNFIAKEFGEENIVSFYAHLDETNVHAHCTLIPVDKQQNRISWRTVFGKNKYEGRLVNYMIGLPRKWVISGDLNAEIVSKRLVRVTVLLRSTSETLSMKSTPWRRRKKQLTSNWHKPKQSSKES